MGRYIVCGNCGKEYDENQVKCPSCGSVNVTGAERAYLEKLEDVREDMEELDDAPREVLQQTIKKQGKFLKGALLAVIAVAVLFTAGILLKEKLEDRSYKAKYLWMQENYPRLDALYDAGNYEEMAELYLELLGDKNSILYEWEHFNFAEAYMTCYFVRSYLEEEKQEELSESTLAFLLAHEWVVKGIVLQKERFTEEEYSALEPYIEMSEADFAARWNMPAEEYDAFQEQLKKNGGQYMDYDVCKEYVKKWIKENR